MSSFDVVTTGTVGTSVDTLEFTVGGANAGTLSCMMPVTQNNPSGAHVSNGNNGGDDSSKFGIQVNVASGQQKYYEDTLAIATKLQTWHHRLHFDTLPSGDRDLFVARMGSTDACKYTITSTGILKLSVNGQNLGTTGEKLLKNRCRDDKNVACANGGGNDSACPGSGNNCNSCSASDGSNCYWADVEVSQSNSSTNTTVKCQLIFNGRLSVDGTPQTMTASDITASRWGAVGSENVALKYWLDDYVDDDSARAYRGPVARLVPSRVGSINNFTSSNCTGSSPNTCVDDYGRTGTNAYTYCQPGSCGTTTDILQASQNNKTTGMQQFSTVPGSYVPLSTTDKIEAVQGYIVGRTSSASTSVSWHYNLQVCPPASAYSCTASANCDKGSCDPVNGWCTSDHSVRCSITPECKLGSCVTQPDSSKKCQQGCAQTDSTSLVTSTNTTDRILAKQMMTITPISSQRTWSLALTGGLGMNVIADTFSGSIIFRLGALLYNVRIQTSDAPLPINGLDHDAGRTCTCVTDAECADVLGTSGTCKNGKCRKGAGDKMNCSSNNDCAAGRSCTYGDGASTILTFGDSTNANTLASTCSNGHPCTQSKFCSWDSILVGGNEDTPLNTCDGISCQTCQNRRVDFYAGAGYPCGPNNNGATCNLGTCSGGVCTGNGAVTCSVDADCDLGNCDTCTNADCSGQTPVSTCQNSCPGVEQCPQKAVWGAAMASAVGSDNFISCGVPGQPLIDMARNWSDIMTMNISSIPNYLSFCAIGPGTGQCSCGTEEDCGGTTGSTNYCQGSTGNKLCVSGSSTQANCYGVFQKGTCASGQFCKFPKPDEAYLMASYNDVLTFQSPECNGPGSFLLTNVYGSTQCAQCTPTSCSTDNDCQTGTPGVSDSFCQGTFPSLGSTRICNQDGLNEGACSVHSTGTAQQTPSGCNVDGDCPTAYTAAGGHCQGGTPGKNYFTGFCGCGADANPGPCDTGYQCKGGYCRRQCTTDAQCGGSPFTCVSGVCKGKCTCPSDAISCTSDKDCDPRVFAGYQGVDSIGWHSAGYCKPNNKCACTGIQGCSDDVAVDYCTDQWKQLRSTTGGLAIYSAWKKIAAITKGLVPAGTTPPLFVPVIPVDMTRNCEDSRPGLSEIQWASQRVLETFPLVCNGRQATSGLATKSIHSDAVHIVEAGSIPTGLECAKVHNALNNCASASGWTGAVIKYCKNNDTGTFATSGCPTDATNCTCILGSDCSASQTCQPKPCNSDGDCAVGICNTESRYYF